MPVKIKCSECGVIYAISDDRVGKKILCRECDASFVARAVKVGRADPDEEDDRPARKKREEIQERESRPARKLAARTFDEEEEDSRPRTRSASRSSEDEEDPRPKRTKARSGSPADNGLPWAQMLGGVGALVLMLVGGGVGMYFLLGRAKTPETAEAPTDEPSRAIRSVEPIVNSNPIQRAGTNPFTPPITGAPGNGQLAADVLSKVKAATAFLRVQMSDGAFATGSGFAAELGGERGIVLTNAHVLGMLDPESRPPRRVDVAFNSGETNEMRLSAVILGVDRGSDLAVLRVTATALPPPLQVKPAAGLVHTQKVYIFGFPLGERLGKEITIRESSVSSLRKDVLGGIQRIQVHGGMDPGNSGGPVVDAGGNVVGVAVAGIVGTQINFAVPGEYVGVIAEGRVQEIGMDSQAYVQPGGGVGQTVRLGLVDPLARIKEVAVEVWAGDPSEGVRLPSHTQPGMLPGDTPHVRHALSAVNGLAQGEVPLPPLAGGKRLWVQPYWVNGAGRPQWASPVMYNIDLKSNPPMRRKAATLLLRHVAIRRPLELTTTNTMRLRLPDGEHSFAVTMNARLQEEVKPDVEGALVGLKYTGFNINLSQDGQPRTPSPKMKRLVESVPLVVGLLRMDSAGNLTINKADFGKVPAAAREDVTSMHEQVQHGLEAMAIPLPNRLVQPGDKWKASRTLPIDTVGKFENGVMEMTYEFRGTRMSRGREEAVIGLTGVLRGPKAQEERIGGSAQGVALVDLATGQVTLARMSVPVDMLSSRDGGLRMTGTLNVKLTRALP